MEHCLRGNGTGAVHSQSSRCNRDADHSLFGGVKQAIHSLHEMSRSVAERATTTRGSATQKQRDVGTHRGKRQSRPITSQEQSHRPTRRPHSTDHPELSNHPQSDIGRRFLGDSEPFEPKTVGHHRDAAHRHRRRRHRRVQ